MHANIIIFSKNDGRPFSVSQESANVLLKTGKFLSLKTHLSNRGVNHHGQRIHVPTEREEVIQGNGVVKMCDVDKHACGDCSKTNDDHQSLSESRQEIVIISPSKRGRGRPKAVKVEI